MNGWYEKKKKKGKFACTNESRGGKETCNLVIHSLKQNKISFHIQNTDHCSSPSLYLFKIKFSRKDERSDMDTAS